MLINLTLNGQSVTVPEGTTVLDAAECPGIRIPTICHVKGIEPAAPIPDLLFTATALRAMSCVSVPLDSVRDPCLDFIHSLWTGNGSFLGSWADNTLDCEYTYYGLPALGHLDL